MRGIALLVAASAFACSPRNDRLPVDASGQADVAAGFDAEHIDALVVDGPTDAATDADAARDAHLDDAASVQADAAVDAPPQGGVCTPSAADPDGDCLPSTIDDCPDIADPSQIDLDGDHIGWLCDPVETFSFASQNISISNVAAYRDTFAAGFCSQSTQSCGGPIVQVSANDKLIIPAGSTNPLHQWTQSRTLQPTIDQEQHVWWSHGSTTSGQTGFVDTGTGAFSMMVPGVVDRLDSGYLDDDLRLLAVRPGWIGVPNAIYSPQGGHLIPVDSGTPISDHLYNQGPHILPTAPATKFFYPLATTFTGPFAIRSYDLASLTTSDVIVDGTPATNLNNLIAYRTWDIATGSTVADRPFCLRRGSTVTFVSATAAGITSSPLPFGDCPEIMRIIGGVLILFGHEGNGSTHGIVTVRAGVVSYPIAGLASSYALDIYGDQISVLATAQSSTSPIRQVIAIGPTAPVTLASLMAHPAVSYAGDVVHVAGIDNISGATGDLVVVRYRPATGVQRIVLATGVSTSVEPKVVTTAEGAALVGTPSSTWIVASSSTTPIVATAFTLVSGHVAGSTTVITGTPPLAMGDSLYAYDELTTMPRLTRLTMPGEGRVLPIHEGWFGIIDVNILDGRVVRIVPDANNLPSLEFVTPMQSLRFFETVKTTVPGTVGVELDSKIYLMTATTFTLVATRTSDFIRDWRVQGSPAVGWAGTDSLGDYACLASHPERCWSLPGTFEITRWADAATTPDGQFGFLKKSGNSDFTIIRSLGNGTRPQPLQ